MKNRRIIFLLTLCSFFFSTAYSQIDPGKAEEFFNHHNYSFALKEYQKLLKIKPNSPGFNYKAGFCIMHLYMDKSKAIPYLETAIKSPNADPDAFYYLALAYHYDLKFDLAEKYYKKYQSIGKGKNQSKVPRQLEMLANARKLVPSPVDVTFQDLGDNVNSPYPDYYPFCTPDESKLIFTSRRKGNKGGMLEFDGYYGSDIWIANEKDGKFEKARNATMINGPYDEQAVGLTFSGDTVFVYKDNIKEKGDIFYSVDKHGRYNHPKLMGPQVNSKAFESAATISADGNTMFFSSDRKGGYGQKDIWMTRKLPNGKWALPQNLGPNVNSKYDEDFPQLFYYGYTLYFCSNGRSSIGGYDLFKSQWNPEKNTWSPARNLGYPINTPEDERTICFTKDKRYAYISAWRPGGHGNLDIYRITFNDIAPEQTLFKTKVLEAGDSSKAIANAQISITDNFNDNTIGNYLPNPNNNSFVLILKPGSYTVMIDADGYTSLTKVLIVKGKSDFKPFIKKNFYMKKSN